MTDANSRQPEPIGQQTMSPAMADMHAYPAYLLRQVSAAIGENVWEIGVGNGQTSIALLRRGCQVLATDIDPNCLDQLERRVDQQLPEARHRLVALEIDLNLPDSLKPLRAYQADSVVTFNVLEHIENDGAALHAIAHTVKPDGKLGMVVPALPSLFGRMDSEAGHYRRYTRTSLTALLERSGWRVKSCRYINALGAAGWWFHNRVRKSAGLKDPGFNHQMRLSDRWLPRIALVTDRVFAAGFGLSLAVVAQSRVLASETD